VNLCHNKVKTSREFPFKRTPNKWKCALQLLNHYKIYRRMYMNCLQYSLQRKPVVTLL